MCQPAKFKHVAVVLALVLAASLGAQEAPAQSVGPQVGDVAPNFTLPGATMLGPSQTPVRLSDLQGQTVVIAFFPKARTGG